MGRLVREDLQKNIDAAQSDKAVQNLLRKAEAKAQKLVHKNRRRQRRRRRTKHGGDSKVHAQTYMEKAFVQPIQVVPATRTTPCTSALGDRVGASVSLWKVRCARQRRAEIEFLKAELRSAKLSFSRKRRTLWRR